MRRALLFASALFLLPLLATLVAADCAQSTRVIISSSDEGYTLRSADRTFAENDVRHLVTVRSSSGRRFYRVSEVQTQPFSRCRITPVYAQSSDGKNSIPRYSHSLARCGRVSIAFIPTP